ncbi:MAG TPA: beta-N-acetylhexosaminidase [Candidatus Cloacimonadota bacterium]|nr:beta-N-acetylhexosaminidase [Candidatus Cloacimonadota bacterium]
MIPRPVEVQLSGSRYVNPGKLVISNCPDPALTELLESGWNRILHCPQAAATSLRFHQMPRIGATHKDMHLVSITEDGITLSAKSRQGFLYAIQSLLQMLHEAVSSAAGLPIGRIVDYPAYEWRGLHLDESRHFFGVNTVKRYLRIMRALKLNKFHWHLSDDQGWRIQSKLHPLLCEKGAYRAEPDGSTYGGYYTQDEIREIVAYASELGIEVTPEIDLPGHTTAILAAYPHLACFPRNFQPRPDWGVFPDILCAGNDELIVFLDSLLKEIAGLFPSPFIHLGGDEAPKERWQACPKCQKRIRELNLKNEEQLQSWLFHSLAKSLQQMGKQVIGWDEILDGQIDPSLIVMAWRGDGKAAAQKAGANRNPYILCPNQICYFDWKEHATGPGAHGISNLANVFSLNPNDYANPELCLGGQANLWTEHIHDQKELEAMLMPRAFALAERLWNPNTDYQDFLNRLGILEGYFDTL